MRFFQVIFKKIGKDVTTQQLMTVYLDHNAAAPLSQKALKAMEVAMASQANPSSVHKLGRHAHQLVEEVRDRVASAVGAERENVTFTSSGTEACALILRLPGRSRLIISAIEHTAVFENAPNAIVAPVDGAGRIDLEALKQLLGQDASDSVVALMLANNETGVIQPVAEAAELAHSVGALLAVDCAQAFGKIDIDMNALGADAIALSASKIGGPLGVGAAIFRKGLSPVPLISGGGQERGIRGGTENVVGIAGFGGALSDLSARLSSKDHIRSLRDRLEVGIREIDPTCQIAGEKSPRLSNTSSIAMAGIKAETQVIALDLAGFAVSAGAACSSGKVASSHVLKAMGLPEEQISSTIRISLGPETTLPEIDGFVQAWRSLYTKKNSNHAADLAG